MDSLEYYIPQSLLEVLFLLFVILKQAGSVSGSAPKSLRLEENWISPKLSDMKIEIVELFIITLAGILGGLTNPFKSSLTNIKSPSLTTQGSSL